MHLLIEDLCCCLPTVGTFGHTVYDGLGSSASIRWAVAPAVRRRERHHDERLLSTARASQRCTGRSKRCCSSLGRLRLRQWIRARGDNVPDPDKKSKQQQAAGKAPHAKTLCTVALEFAASAPLLDGLSFQLERIHRTDRWIGLIVIGRAHDGCQVCSTCATKAQADEGAAVG